jgi:hypothetical protein
MNWKQLVIMSMQAASSAHGIFALVYKRAAVQPEQEQAELQQQARMGGRCSC